MPLDPLVIKSFSRELQKLAGVDLTKGIHAKFDAVAGILRDHGVHAETSHKRIIIPKDIITTEDLGYLGFKPSMTAVPEEGQDSLISFRHPQNRYHFHSHGSVWTMHEDAHAATQGFNKETLHHAITDGLPAFGAYVRQRALDPEGSLAEKVRLALPQDFFDKMEALRH
jgi:hypothetical protein